MPLRVCFCFECDGVIWNRFFDGNGHNEKRRRFSAWGTIQCNGGGLRLDRQLSHGGAYAPATLKSGGEYVYRDALSDELQFLSSIFYVCGDEFTTERELI